MGFFNFNEYYFHQSSSCLSDREEEDLYDFANKYQGMEKLVPDYSGQKSKISG